MVLIVLFVQFVIGSKSRGFFGSWLNLTPAPLTAQNPTTNQSSLKYAKAYSILPSKSRAPSLSTPTQDSTGLVLFKDKLERETMNGFTRNRNEINSDVIRPGNVDDREKARIRDFLFFVHKYEPTTITSTVIKKVSHYFFSGRPHYPFRSEGPLEKFLSSSGLITSCGLMSRA